MDTVKEKYKSSIPAKFNWRKYFGLTDSDKTPSKNYNIFFEATKIFLTFLSILVALLGIYKEYQNIKIEREATHINQVINNKISVMRKSSDAIMDLRLTREHIILKCKTNQPLTFHEQQQLRLNARDKVAREFTGTRFLFGEKLQEKSIELVVFDEGVIDVCSPNNPKQDKWHQYHTDIINLMGKSIQADEKKLEALNYGKKMPYTINIKLN